MKAFKPEPLLLLLIEQRVKEMANVHFESIECMIYCRELITYIGSRCTKIFLLIVILEQSEFPTSH